MIRFALYQPRRAPRSRVSHCVQYQAHGGGSGSPVLVPTSLGTEVRYENASGSDIRESGRACLGVPCWSRAGFGEWLRVLVFAFRVRLWNDMCSSGCER